MISELYLCQYPGRDIILQFCKMVPLGETGKSVQRITVLGFFKIPEYKSIIISIKCSNKNL